MTVDEVLSDNDKNITSTAFAELFGLSTGQPYHDLGPDHFEQRQDPQRQAERLVKKLAELGYTATLRPAA